MSIHSIARSTAGRGGSFWSGPGRLLPYRVTLVSPHDPATCVERLRAIVDTSFLGDWGSDATLRGSVGTTRLSVHKAGVGRNSFGTYVRGNVEQSEDGAALHLSVGAHPASLSFVGCWLTFTLLMLFTSTALPAHVSVSELAGSLAFYALFAAPVVFARWAARHEDAFILDQIRRATDAVDA